MTPDMMVVTDLDGKKISGEREPSSELKMHLEVYRNRPDARAVVHAHPPTATGFAVAGIPLDRAVLAEVITTLGSIPIAEYATPSTDELPAACSKYLKAHDGLLLANHGALALAADVFTAYYRMETIEHFAKISLVARTLGRENLLSRDEVERLQGLRGMYGIASPAPICADDTVPVAPAASWSARWCRRRRRPAARGSSPTLPALRRIPRFRGRRRRGNSANIPRADGTDRRRGSQLEIRPRPLVARDGPGNGPSGRSQAVEETLNG